MPPPFPVPDFLLAFLAVLAGVAVVVACVTLAELVEGWLRPKR